MGALSAYKQNKAETLHGRCLLFFQWFLTLSPLSLRQMQWCVTLILYSFLFHLLQVVTPRTGLWKGKHSSKAVCLQTWGEWQLSRCDRKLQDFRQCPESAETLPASKPQLAESSAVADWVLPQSLAEPGCWCFLAPGISAHNPHKALVL